MSLSTAEVAAVVQDLKPRLEGGRIERMDQSDPHRLVLYVRNGPALYWLLICTAPRFSRLHLLTRRPERGKPAGGFCSVLRQHLTTAPLEVLRQVPEDRVVVLGSVFRDRLMRPHPVKLVAELFGPRSNMLLVDESDRILAVNRRMRSGGRELVPGAVYRFPEPAGAPSEKARLNRFAAAADPTDPLALSRAIQAHYARLEAAHGVEEARSELLRALKGARRRTRRRLADVERALEQARSAEAIRRQGELLKMALGQIRPRSSEVVVQDVFEPDAPEVTIALNPALSPQDNVQALFRRYKKAKAGEGHLAERQQKLAAEAEAIEQLLGPVEGAAGTDDLEGLRSRAAELGILPRPARAPRRSGRTEPKGPRSFRSKDGREILVSRGARENERLTFTIARGNDYWLHLADWPGPHVVVRAPGGEISDDALLDAAHLAVYFSKVRGADQADVVYTQCKNVRRARGGGPGRVSHARARTLRVRMSAERLRRLLEPR